MKRVLDVLNSLTFRFIARYVTVLVASVFVLQMLLYAYFSYAYFRDLGEEIEEEMGTLQLIHAGQGVPGLRQYFRDRAGAPGGMNFSYLVSGDDGEALAGDLKRAPHYREFAGDWFGFQTTLWQHGGERDVDFLGLSRDLGSGVRALVAYNVAAAAESGSLVFDTLVRGMVATLILGIIGGFITASFALGRLEDFSRRLSRIVRENVSERMPLEGQEGYLRELSVVTNDVLDQMALLMQGVKQVSDNIAHDLRTPLTRIRNNLNQLRARLPAGEQEAVDRVIEECDDLLASFNALLRISALESGSRAAIDNALDLRALLADVVELYEPLANDKGISLHLEAPDAIELHADTDLLFQLFTNLVDNAIKYTPPGGHIAVRAYRSPEGANCIEVCDDGPGIPPGDRETVFRRFHRLEASRGKEPGHGLGLSLVQAIVQYHRGSVRLLDNGPGLRVVVQLPGEPGRS